MQTAQETPEKWFSKCSLPCDVPENVLELLVPWPNCGPAESDWGGVSVQESAFRESLYRKIWTRRPHEVTARP